MSSQRCKLRITKRGMSFVLFGLLLLLASFNTGENLFYLITCSLISFLLTAWWVTRRSVRHISLKRNAPNATHRNETFASSLLLENLHRRKTIRSIELQSENFEKPYYIDTIPANNSIQSRLYATMPKRGAHILPTIRISSSFPFGLFEQHRIVDDQQTILVYPRIYPLSQQILKELDDNGQTPKASFSNDGNEFYSLREYIPGDDIRLIAWKISARIGQLIIRELEPSITRMVMLVLDTRGIPETQEKEEQFEHVIDLAASLTVFLLEKHFAVGLQMPDAHVSMSKGHHQSTQILEALTILAPLEESDYSDDWYKDNGHSVDAIKIHLATDSARWGVEVPQSRTRTLNPEEVLNG